MEGFFSTIAGLTDERRRGPRGSVLITVILRCLLGGVFVFAGVLKAMDPSDFEKDIENFRLLPSFLIPAVAYYLPYLEIVLGLGLITGIAYAGSLLTCGGLLFVFFVALVSALLRGLDIQCGCFGKAGAGSSIAVSLVVDVALAAMWVGLCAAYLRRKKW